MSENGRKNTLGDLNDILFNEIDRLDAASPSDPDAMNAEIERAKAIKSLAGTVIANGHLVLEAARASSGTYDSVQVPKMLEGAH